MNNLISSIVKDLHLENPKNNWVFSPASYMSAINNLLLCLKDRNLTEFLHILNITEDQLVEYVKSYNNVVTANTQNYNAFLFRESYKDHFNSEVEEALLKLKVEIKYVDGNAASITEEINRTVAEKTNGVIQDLIVPGDIDNLIIFIILNCIYFRGKWYYEFRKSTIDEVFYGSKKLEFIKYLELQNKNLQFYEDELVDIVEIPYKNSDVCCYLIVPDSNIFNIFETIQENYNKIKLVKTEFNTEVNLKVPEFTAESSYSLKEVTRRAGAGEIFAYSKDWKLLDFTLLNSATGIKVDKIIQKAKIRFDKDGTEAAAATAIIGLITGYFSFSKRPPKIKYIRADKPFIYILADKKNLDIPLFIGVVNNFVND